LAAKFSIIVAPVTSSLQTLVRRAEWIVAIVLSLVVLSLLIIRATHGGALWRDEAGAIQLVRMSTIAEFREQLRFESFPVLFYAILRGVTDLFGTSDATLRIFGAVAGAMLLGAAWRNARIFGSAPLIFLALIGLNTTFLLWGTSFRSYGIACSAMVFAVGAAVNAVLRPGTKSLVLFGVSWFVAAQLLYFNFLVLGAVGVGMVAVFLARRKIKFALIIVAIAIGIAASYVPYFLMNSRLDWRVITNAFITVGIAWQRFEAACGEPKSISPFIWSTLILATVTMAVGRLVRLGRTRSSPDFDLLLLAVTTAVVMPVPYYWFIRMVGYSPQPWHFLALLCLVATIIELIVAVLCRSLWSRLLRLCLVIVLSVLLPTAAWPNIFKRHTNIDLVARKLTETAGPNDLIVVHLWTFGISFNWSYHGNTRWETVPIIADHRSFRFDLFKAKMMETHPLDDLEQEITTALRSGSRVWLVGDPKQHHPAPAHISLPPDPVLGWNQEAFRNAWWQQTIEFLEQHAQTNNRVMSGSANVIGYENPPLWVADGWRE
jgi:hypothetical protein